ncbi:MAG TPA: hypothetical protein ENK06_09840 [Gammaproteobacteria bacterium]|nr:hypothetical protein [Gammaproteobacteria bacterium]
MASDSENHWFWRYGYIAMVPLVLLVVWVAKSDNRENQNNVNPEVFAAFKKIEQDCQSVSFDAQSQKCLTIAAYQKDCKLISSNCNSQSFYALLKSLNFQLPRYYKDGFIEQ